MAKSKKTKIHKKMDGQLLQMNKSFNNLKLKQKEKITAWVYEEYKMILSILVYTFFSRIFDLMLPPVMNHSTAAA